MRWLLYLILGVVVAGCSDGLRQCHALDEAEAMMEGSPQEALERLNNVEISSLADSGLMARWALLYGEALVANRMYAPTDTIIDIAIDYYGVHNVADKLQRARALKSMLTVPDGEAYDAAITSMYLQKEREYYRLREAMRRDRLITWGIVMLLVAAGVILWQRQRLKIGRLRMDAMLAGVADLKSRMRQGECERSGMQAALTAMLARRFELLDSLCETYYESQGTKAEQKAISARVKAEIDAMRSDSAMFSEMERAVNDCRGNILALLRSEYAAIKPDEYRLAVYLACGLSYRTIALLMDEPVDVLYKRKSRLKARVKAASPAHGDEIAAIL